MKTLEHQDECAKMECDCGQQFYVDACLEENLEWSPEKKSLIAVCPRCGKRDE
jgi:hypothetical protein